MSEPVAAMPPEILREVILRLVCPENPPPPSATSEIGLREQQATASLRPAAALKLSRSTAAVGFLERYNASPALIDEVAGLFLDVVETPSRFAGLVTKRALTTLVFEEVLYAHRIIMLGGSLEMMERLIPHLVAGGWWREAETLSQKLGRRLTRDEVLGLVESYTKGASQNSDSDQFWPQFAERYLGVEGGQIARRWISERNARWANELY